MKEGTMSVEPKNPQNCGMYQHKSYQLRGLYRVTECQFKEKKQTELQWQHISPFFIGLQNLQLKLLVPTMQKDQQSSNFSAHYQSHKNKQLPCKNIQ